MTNREKITHLLTNIVHNLEKEELLDEIRVPKQFIKDWAVVKSNLRYNSDALKSLDIPEHHQWFVQAVHRADAELQCSMATDDELWILLD